MTDGYQLKIRVNAGQAAALARQTAVVLNEAGVYPAPLKSVLLNATVYAHGAPSPVGDVDLLVAPAQFAVSEAALRRAGASRVNAQRHASTWRLQTSPMLLDLHRHAVDPGWFRLGTEGLLARAATSTELFEPATVVVLEPYDVYVHLVADFVKSRRGAVNVGRLRDLGAWARGRQLDSVKLARRLVESGVARAARYVLALAAVREGDRFAGAVLAALPNDPIGALLAEAALAGMSRRGAHWATVPLGHALNSSLGRGGYSLLRSVAARLSRGGERS